MVSDARYRSLCDALLICGYSDMSREAYAPLLAWRDEAAALGSASYRRNARASDLRRGGLQRLVPRLGAEIHSQIGREQVDSHLVAHQLLVKPLAQPRDHLFTIGRVVVLLDL